MPDFITKDKKKIPIGKKTKSALKKKDLVSGKDYHQSFDNTFGITKEPNGLDTSEKREQWMKEHTAELIGNALSKAPRDKIKRPVLSHADWIKIAKSNKIKSKDAEDAWNKFGKWHWEQHMKQTPIINSDTTNLSKFQKERLEDRLEDVQELIKKLEKKGVHIGDGSSERNGGTGKMLLDAKAEEKKLLKQIRSDA